MVERQTDDGYLDRDDSQVNNKIPAGDSCPDLQTLVDRQLDR